MLGTALLDRAEAGADLDTLHGIDAHHGARQIRIEPFEHGLTPTRRHSLGDHGHARTDGISRLANAPDELLELFDALGSGQKKGLS